MEYPKSVTNRSNNLQLDDDLNIALHVLDSSSESVQPVAYLQSVEEILANVAAAPSISQQFWPDVMNCLDEIQTLLRDYRSDLERAAHLPRHRTFSLDEYHNGMENIPNHFMPCLKGLCSSIKHVIYVLQKHRNAQKLPHLLLWRWDLQKEIEHCHNELTQALNDLNACAVPKTIYQVALGEQHTLLDVMEHATPERYRLVECSQLVKHNVLCINEFLHFPHVPYAAVSYVWRGNAVETGYTALEFSVVGAEKADPIGVEVLHDACTAALALGAAYLWIDRLCIMQTDEGDKSWQIREMYDMYRCCVMCIVIAGGLRRLVTLSEETGWIHRGWTLQEALAPPSIVVLFGWKLGKCKARSGDSAVETVEEVVPERSAMTSLTLLLDACTTGYLSFEHKSGSKMVQTKLFSSHPFNHTYNDIPFWQPTRRVMSPNVSALALAMSKEMDINVKQYAIWQSALMRTSSRPVDMIFSIMGLFGISLDTKAFGKNDRIGATIALAQQILQRDGRANWLGISFRAAPCPFLSTFPTFPRTRVSGKALVHVGGGNYREVSELMENEYPVAEALVPLPQGSMDGYGYLTFDAKAVRIVPDIGNSSASVERSEIVAERTRMSAVDGSTWVVSDGEGEEAGLNTFAVLLGFLVGYYPGATPALNDRNVRAILVQEHAPGKFHVRSYFMLSGKSMTWRSNWTQRTFCVGGPETRKEIEEIEDPNEPLPEVSVVDHALLANIPTSRRAPTTLKEQTERKARWAVPQHVLEKHSKE